ncbi:MAG: chromosomal replication initiator protein DnaA [Verrucomicrobiales bacterium]|jgi:chromosomal replication initiator protein|nr:chromosomal replication initiator protein DnaA [Verrucomicrobiales bacterium]
MQETMISDPHEIWQKTCHELQKLISPDAFRRWFSPIKPISFESGRLVLGVDNSIYPFWIEENYSTQLKESLGLAFGRDVDVTFEVTTGRQHDTENAANDNPVDESAEEGKGSIKTAPAGDLIPRYVFETFVVGANNEFATAAAKAVAESPAKIYNPLFVHGAVGLGKTHLMHAIGHQIVKNKKGGKPPKVVYVTSEQFTNEFITAIQHGEIIKFRKRFRQADLLLIDDIQFFAGKERSQEEFFHTFNALFDGNKQIVLTSDCPPSEVKNLEQRLVSRFEWGLAAELAPPDIETRLAILKAKAAKMDVRLGDGVLTFIAERVKANIRRLEGALNRVAAWAALNDKKLTQAQVEELLKDFIQQEARNALTIETIQKRVAETFDIRMTDMTSKRRPNNIAIPRMIAMYLCRKLTPKSLQEIGEAFGGRDHGTVLHACKKVEADMAKDENLRQQINFLLQKLEVAR